jgi:hypothetical protein
MFQVLQFQTTPKMERNAAVSKCKEIMKTYRRGCCAHLGLQPRALAAAAAA